MNNQEENLQEKRAESKKFLKIYMITLVLVVVGLIGTSFLSQERLNTEIEVLTNLVNSTKAEKIGVMSTVEDLQELVIEQGDTIKKYEKNLLEFEKNIENQAKQQEQQEKITDIYKAYIDENYELCMQNILEIDKEQLEEDVKLRIESINAQILEFGYEKEIQTEDEE